MHIRLAHSPDPDDAFMFYGLACGAVDPGPYTFEHVLADIQTLNERAGRGEYELTAVSIHAYPYLADRYGPLLVTRGPASHEEPNNLYQNPRRKSGAGPRCPGKPGTHPRGQGSV